MAEILVVDDEVKIGKLLVAELEDAGYKAQSTTDPMEALALASKSPVDIVVTDIRMPGMDGIELLRRIGKKCPSTDVIVMTAYASVETALAAMKEGAYDYIIKPFKTEELIMLIERLMEKRRLEEVNRGLRSYISGSPGGGIVGASESMGRVRSLIDNLAHSEAPVLIQGESGTGKELVARAIHESSRRAAGPFIAINCAAIPENLLESELFGYERGAFTGASRRRLGHFQLAEGGTLFLDEVGDLPLSLQGKLLRALEQGCVMPLGGEKEVEVDIRLISATNKSLEEEMKSGRFREDLYYRLNVFPISLPPLREHREDIRELARHFLQSAGRSPGDLTDGALRKLIRYDWPGNVRELRNVLERAMIIRPSGKIEEADIVLGSMQPSVEAPPETLNLEEMEKKLVLRALKIAAGNKSEAARLLGITRRALYGRLEKFGIEE